MKKGNQLVVTGLELVKTIAGVGVGRLVAVKGAEMLKISEEADEKKANIKKMALGGGVLAVGTIGALKAPDAYKSLFAGIATAGALSAMSPYAKTDEGFIPALHGGIGTAMIEDEDDEKILLELNGEQSSYADLLEEEEAEDSYYTRSREEPSVPRRSLSSVESEDVDFEEMGDEMN